MQARDEEFAVAHGTTIAYNSYQVNRDSAISGIMGDRGDEELNGARDPLQVGTDSSLPIIH